MNVGSIQAESARLMQAAQRASMQNKVKGFTEDTMALLLENLKIAPSPDVGKNVDLSV